MWGCSSERVTLLLWFPCSGKGAGCLSVIFSWLHFLTGTARGVQQLRYRNLFLSGLEVCFGERETYYSSGVFFSSWSFSSLLAYNSSNVLGLTCCRVFPAPLPCKKKIMLPLRCNTASLGLGLLAWVLGAERTGSKFSGRSCIWRWRVPCPTARDIPCWGQGTCLHLQAICMHLIIPLSSWLFFWQCEGATWMEVEVWFLLETQHCFEKECSGGGLFVTEGGGTSVGECHHIHDLRQAQEFWNYFFFHFSTWVFSTW